MKRTVCRTARGAVSVLMLLVFFVPVYWMLLTAVKTMGQCYQTPPAFWASNPAWDNFTRAFEAIPFWNMLKNSLIVTAGTLLCQCVTVIPAAYAFARMRFRGEKLLFGAVLATMMIPAQLIFLPVFLLFSQAGLINSYISLIIPHGTSAFAIFMLRQTFRQVPDELLEAARLDKAGQWKIITRIMLPLARPTLLTLCLLTLVTTWSDYFWPFVMTTNNDVRTLSVGVSMLRIVDGGVDYPALSLEQVERPLYRLILMAPPEQTAAIARRVEALALPGIRIERTAPDFVELMNANAGKREALERLCRANGIPLDRVAFIGDFYNDLDLMRCAGLSACVSEAPREVRSQCALVLSGCMDGAVADFLEALSG